MKFLRLISPEAQAVKPGCQACVSAARAAARAAAIGGHGLHSPLRDSDLRGIAMNTLSGHSGRSEGCERDLLLRRQC